MYTFNKSVLWKRYFFDDYSQEFHVRRINEEDSISISQNTFILWSEFIDFLGNGAILIEKGDATNNLLVEESLFERCSNSLSGGCIHAFSKENCGIVITKSCFIECDSGKSGVAMYLNGTLNGNSHLFFEHNTINNIQSEQGDTIRLQYFSAFIKSQNMSDIKTKSVSGLSIVNCNLKCIYSSFRNSIQEQCLIYLYQSYELIFSDCNVLNNLQSNPTSITGLLYINACIGYLIKVIFYGNGNSLFHLAMSATATCNYCAFDNVATVSSVTITNKVNFVTTLPLVLPNRDWCWGELRTETASRSYSFILVVSTLVGSEILEAGNSYF